MQHHTRSDIDLLTSKEVAELLGVSVGCLLHWRQKGDGPPSRVSALARSFTTCAILLRGCNPADSASRIIASVTVLVSARLPCRRLCDMAGASDCDEADK
jgi:hypothetical protein